MNLTITYNLQTINFTLIKKPNLKHTYITIQENGKVVVKANQFITQKVIKNFVKQKAPWILKKQAIYKNQNHKLYLGKPCLHDNKELISKENAKNIILPLVDKWCAIMNLYPNHVGFRNNKTRWGSCSHNNRISLNIQLLKLPISSIEYVIVHELAHIKHKNHSKEFWTFVEKFLPDFKTRQKTLKSIMLTN